MFAVVVRLNHETAALYAKMTSGLCVWESRSETDWGLICATIWVRWSQARRQSPKSKIMRLTCRRGPRSQINGKISRNRTPSAVRWDPAVSTAWFRVDEPQGTPLKECERQGRRYYRGSRGSRFAVSWEIGLWNFASFTGDLVLRMI